MNAAYADKTLIFSIHPYKSATILNKSFSPLALYLLKAIDQNIAIKISKNYQSHIDLIGSDSVDIAYMGPASYVKLVNKYGKKRLLSRLAINGIPTFRGMIIVPTNSEIRTLQMLKNKRFAFGSTSSTMSHLVPRFMLIKAGVPISSFKKHAFVGNHINVALGVLS